MAFRDGTDPAIDTPVPLDGDGEELVGTVIDNRYRLEATIGRGGMGLVYRASHLGLRRQVALKILHPALAASSDVRNRFEREALSVGRVDHPNCVTTYDVGRLPGGALYLAMELLEGRALSEVLEREGQIPPARALHILAHILRGLGGIHRAGLIHRDIKPENIFLIRQGDDVEFAKILDFGIAKPLKGEIDDGVKLTQAGMAFGTPIYMAPEQALGAPMDGRADLYAAAVVGYEMLAGQPPFYSDDKLEVMSMHTAKPVPPIRQRLGKNGRPVPSSIEKIVVRGLTKKPADRYPNADEFLAAVEHALDTRDGGNTDIEFLKPSTTGSQSLVTESGKVRIVTGEESLANALDGDTDGDELPTGVEDGINAAIDEAIAIAAVVPAPSDNPRSSSPVVPRKPATPGTGFAGTELGGLVAKTPASGPAGDATIQQPSPFARPSPAAAPPAQPLARAPAARAAAPHGGVGIGLPYTGPTGEPIFGLTPEQRLAQAAHPPVESGFAARPSLAGATVFARRKRWPLYAAGTGVAIAAGITIGLATHHHAAPESELSPTDTAAADAMERGDVDGALVLLTQQGSAIAADPIAQRILGHAHAARSHYALALAAYAQALTLAPELEADPELRADLRAMAANKDPAVVTPAFDMWLGHTSDPAAKKAIANAAVADDATRRHAVAAVVTKYKADDAVDWVQAYALDLQQGATCELRRDAVVKLRALDDARAVQALELASVRQGATGSRNKKMNACLIDAATEAIGYLRGLGKPP